ncbi:PHB depolymerase family esterase [Parerythrobacter aestuarii]|uniref:PHB depolymerase family esterase n=1 Tax=Parerythrobacter aestuarii TaxID=3020909 RepID=UPI0024DDFF3D|nr:PHB depolymerase family esterase [Parerythrobacter aestuarii]
MGAEPVAGATPCRASESGFHSFGETVPRSYYYHVPATVRRDSPVIVSVHGISLNAAEHMVRMRSLAERLGAVVIAPWFDRTHYRGYQKLLCRDGETRADLALIEILDDVTARFGVDTGSIFLAGFSGGGQFAHRFALLHADRVRSCVTCSAGWYTYPDPSAAYPFGTAAGSCPDGSSPHPDAHKVPIHVLVGSRDNHVEPSLNMDADVVSRQGVGRVTRARRWVKAMQQARSPIDGAPVTLLRVQQMKHDFSKAVDRNGLDALIMERFGLHASGREYDA